ncbi:MAG: (Fe-S)-binding protein [Desulfobacterales bacterium]|nr:MAG: (Fe-S)-binding protein [Desulfobacterales bacterium]
MIEMQDIIRNNRVWYCQECGKCSAVCPITQWESQNFSSPRLLVTKAIDGGPAAVMEDPLFWTCLTCHRCSLLCPSNVYFSDFIRDVRTLARAQGHSGECSHGQIVQTWGKMMTVSDLNQDRLAWISRGLNVSNDSEIIYFSGCLPYYDVLFGNLNFEGVKIARAAIKIMNHLGIAPQVMAHERCCGHDQLWQGDFETFRTLAKLNLEHLSATGAKKIITTCPECAITLARAYPKYIGEHGMEVLHISQFLIPALTDGSLVAGSRNAMRVTYHDPCRLGRHLGVFDEPRTLIRAFGFDLVEMERARQASLCCGTTGWSSCGRTSKNIQLERLQEAAHTGAQLLVTACLKCQIHFRCARSDPMLQDANDFEIQDLTTLIANQLQT